MSNVFEISTININKISQIGLTNPAHNTKPLSIQEQWTLQKEAAEKQAQDAEFERLKEFTAMNKLYQDQRMAEINASHQKRLQYMATVEKTNMIKDQPKGQNASKIPLHQLNKVHPKFHNTQHQWKMIQI